MSTLISKICGLNKSIATIDALQPDLLGFIFWSKSKRYFTGDSIPKTQAKKVGVFVEEEIDVVFEIANKFQLDYVQLHGNESVAYCREISKAGLKIIKVFQVGPEFSFRFVAPFEEFSTYFLFDTAGKLPGGNGTVFNWNQIKEYNFQTPFLLSGGLGIENLEAAKLYAATQDKCIGFDLNSALEISPGNKDIDKVKTALEIIKK